MPLARHVTHTFCAAAAAAAVAVLAGAASPAAAADAPAAGAPWAVAAPPSAGSLTLVTGDEELRDRDTEHERGAQEQERGTGPDREHERGRDHDWGRVDVRVTPASAHPGETVEIRVAGCESDKKATARSEAFVAEVPLGLVGGKLFGEARLSSSIAPGAYPVDVSCDGDPKAGSGKVVVAGKGEPTKEGKPSAPVRAGGGAAAGDGANGDEALLTSADGAGSSGAGSATVAPFGVTLLAGGVLAGAAVIAARRRRPGADAPR